MTQELEKNLEKFADLIVRTGLNLQPGQKLLINAPVAASPLVVKVAEKAYQAGARYVDTNFVDELVTLARFKYAPKDSFTEFPSYKTKMMEEHAKTGNAFLSIAGENPDLLAGQDTDSIATARKAQSENSLGYSKYLMNDDANWCIVSLPVPSWAKKVFPDVSEAEAVDKLWEQIFRATRVDQDDPVAAWAEHDRVLKLRADRLNKKQYKGLKYTGPGTDFYLGLVKDHIWSGGSAHCNLGFEFYPNMPTEEIFTMPDRNAAEGTIRASMPLNYAGALIENFSLTFKDGKVGDVSAEKGLEALKSMTTMDEGAGRLGEVALVPQRSPISESGILFYNTLFDENAASHLALGRAYAPTMKGGSEMNQEELLAHGCNYSLIHVDFMVGSDQMDIDGVNADGSTEPLMRGGNWVDAV